MLSKKTLFFSVKADFFIIIIVKKLFAINFKHLSYSMRCVNMIGSST